MWRPCLAALFGGTVDGPAELALAAVRRFAAFVEANDERRRRKRIRIERIRRPGEGADLSVSTLGRRARGFADRAD